MLIRSDIESGIVHCFRRIKAFKSWQFSYWNRHGVLFFKNLISWSNTKPTSSLYQWIV